MHTHTCTHTRIHTHAHTHTLYSHYISALESYISQESDFFFFITTMRAEYDSWLKQPGQTDFSAISVQKTLKGSIQEVCVCGLCISRIGNITPLPSFPQGLSFVEELYKFWTKYGFKSQVFDPECKKWVLLLLQLVDVTKEHPEVHLQSFLGRSTLMVVKKYRADIIKHVSAEDNLIASELSENL